MGGSPFHMGVGVKKQEGAAQEPYGMRRALLDGFDQ
jgi:hypothetical protein